ncbi:MAG: YraN family protein, partial [SAR324 cluster bacterium]|nr:YraN family protein [SAR324 cluster bacterium]MEC7216874.1 YraN family protein [SAR324 cluster bacterium]
MSARKDLGIDGENLAAKYLESLGYSILERNFRHRH